jgi:hypothetical protein
MTKDEARTIAATIAKLPEQLTASGEHFSGQISDIGMAFAIEWTGPMGPATTHRDGPVEALRFAIEMIGKGYRDVVIVATTNNGKQYNVAEFRQFYVDTKK